MSAEKKSSLPQTQSEKSLLKNENGGEEGKNNSLMVTTLDDALATPNLNPNKINTLGNLARTQQPSPFNPKSQPRSNKPGSKKDDNEEKNAGPEGEPLLEQPSSWNQPSNASSSGQKGDALFPQVVDLLMLCCILTSTYTLWCFPILVLQLGGFYFIIIYLLMLFMIVFPVLHLEIFVGQYCQAGVFKACRSYGLAYEGFGLAVVLTACVCSLQNVQHTYVNLKHIWNLANEPKAIVSCRHIKISDPHAAYRCTSLFDDSFCATEGSGSYYYGKRCFNDSSHVTSQMKAVNHYFEHLTSPPNADFDLPRLLYTFFVYCSLALLGVFGVRVIRLFLAFTYVCFICALLISFAQFVDVARFIIAFKALVRATDPEAIYDIQTYLAAFYASVVSSGLGLSGILCISSFRARNGDSFRLTYGIMFNNVVVSIISLLCFLFAMSAISRQYRLDTTDVTAAGYNFAIAAITEVFMVKEKYVIWLIIYHISVYVVSILTFCGPLIIICAIVRDIAERHRQLWTAWAIIAFCLSAFLASVPRSIVTFGDQWDKTIVMLKDCTTFFVVAIMIVAFVLVYGEREYVIDLSQLYPIKDGDRPWSSPAHPAQIGHFLIAECFAVVTMVMTFVYNFTGYTHSRLVMIVVAACVLFLVILAVIFGFLAYNAYGSIRRAEGMSTLLFVTPEHPSYWRITSFTQVGVDEQTDQLVSANRVTAPQ